ncbi:MAG: hypothetical protein ACOC22_01385 [bacterium]
MSRPIKKNRKLVLFENIINEELNEIFNSKIKTSFKEVQYDNYIAYEFKTNSGASYDLEFHYTKESLFTELNGNPDLTLGYVLKANGIEIDSFDIAFSLSKVINRDNPDEFELETNRHEQFELFARIAYIVDIISKKYNKVKVFVIGAARRNRLEIYKKMFSNLFSNKFELYYGESQNHYDTSLFILRK